MVFLTALAMAEEPGRTNGMNKSYRVLLTVTKT